MNEVEEAMASLHRVIEYWGILLSTRRDIQLGSWPYNQMLEDTVIERLKDVFESKYLQIEERHEIDVSEDNEKFIVHYTSLDTLISVLCGYREDSKTHLRMYDSFHLNDPEEGHYLTRNIDLPEQKASHAYVASFVVPHEDKGQEFGDEDNLTYWLAYGRGGRGCSIKIPVKHNHFRRVLYGQAEVNRTLKALDLPAIQICLKRLTDHSSEAGERLSNAIWGNLARIRYLYKGEAYDYEHECRLVRSALDIAEESEIHFDPVKEGDSSYRVRHYYEDTDLRLDNILVTGSVITLGPLVSRPDNMTFYLESLLTKAGLRGPLIRPSRIPYQGR